MEGPDRSGSPPGAIQQQPVDNEADDSQLRELLDVPRGSAFSRGVRRLRNSIPFLRQRQENPAEQQNRPARTSLRDRTISAAVDLKESRPDAPPEFPHRTAAARLADIGVSIKGGDSASFQNKKELVEAKNLYMTAGISTLKLLRGNLEARIQTLPPDSDEAALAKDSLQGLNGLEQGMQSNINDSRIMNARSPDQMVHQFEKVSRLQDSLVEKLTEFSGEDEANVRELFNEHVRRLDTARTDRRNAQLTMPQSDHAFSTHSYLELLGHQEVMFTSAIKIAKQAATNALASGNPVEQRKLGRLADTLSRQLIDIQQTVALKGGEEPVSKKDIAMAKALPKTLQKQLVKAGLPKEEVRETFHRVQAGELNRKGWEAFEREFKEPHGDRKLNSGQEPANKMRSPDGLPVFKTPYKDGSGVTCVDTGNTEHANNLWKSSFRINGRKLFNGIRHGILDAPAVKNKALKQRAAEAKAKEVLVAALASKPDLYQQALQAGQEEEGVRPPRLLTTSTSLVTTGAKSKKERKMQEQQNKAFEALIKEAQGNVLTLEVPGPDGEPRKVKFELKVSRFNIPVNYGGVGALEKVTSGRGMQRTMNKPAMTELLGKGPEIGGDTAHHLRQIEWQLDQLLSKPAATPDDQLQIEAEIKELTRQREVIIDLSNQIREIYASGSHHSEGHDTYKLAARVVYLTHLIGGVPIFNCKSGKDRTGMLDAEVKLLAARIDRDGKVPQPGPLSEEDKSLFRTILLNSGNHEVQKANMGVKGYKTEHIASIDERVGHQGGREEVRGLSKTVGS